MSVPLNDPFAPLKEAAWQESQELDARLAAGDLDEAGWHEEWQRIVVPAYLAAPTPWEQSGKSGTYDDWVYARSLLVDALDWDGSFLDVGCANGFLMECLPSWANREIEPFGLEIAPELAELARRRLPHWTGRIWVGNALDWAPPRQFTYVRANLDAAPPDRRHDLVRRLLEWGERVVIGVFGEHESERSIERELADYGIHASGRSARPNRRKPGMEYRVLWLDN